MPPADIAFGALNALLAERCKKSDLSCSLPKAPDASLNASKDQDHLKTEVLILRMEIQALRQRNTWLARELVASLPPFPAIKDARLAQQGWAPFTTPPQNPPELSMLPSPPYGSPPQLNFQPSLCTVPHSQLTFPFQYGNAPPVPGIALHPNGLPPPVWYPPPWYPPSPSSERNNFNNYNFGEALDPKQCQLCVASNMQSFASNSTPSYPMAAKSAHTSQSHEPQCKNQKVTAPMKGTTPTITPPENETKISKRQCR